MIKFFNKAILFATVLFCIFSLTDCSELFEPRVAMQAGKSAISTLERLVVGQEKITKLDPPQQIFVSNNAYNNKIVISWTAVENASSYRLERAVVKEKVYGQFMPPDESEFDVIQHTSAIYGTHWEDDIIGGNITPTYKNEEYNWAYFYRVCAENKIKKYDSSEYINSAVATLLAPVTEVAATQGASSEAITLTWNKVQGASDYEIWRSENPDGTNPARIDQISSNRQEWSDVVKGNAQAQGKDFYYTINAITSSGQKSVSSNIAYGYSLLPGAPSQVQNVKIVKGRGDGSAKDGIELSWDAIPADTGLTRKYAIYRSSSADPSLEKITDCESTTYKDTKGLKENTYYYYQIQAWHEKEESGKQVKYKGAMSDSSAKSATPAEGFLLSPPNRIEVLKQGGALNKMRFTPSIGAKGYPEDSGTKGGAYKTYTYKIYASDTNSNAPFTECIVSGWSATELVEGFLVKEVDSRKFYKVSTVNAQGEESSQSAVVAPAPYAPKNPSATKNAFIKDVTDSDNKANESGVFPVQITWEVPDEGASGGYHIYRSEKQDSGYRKITENPVSGKKYIDKYDSAKAGKIYYYKVLSLNSLGQGANYSTPVQGYGALTAEQYMREYNKTIINSQESKLTYMFKKPDTSKIGKETVYGNISGSLYYDAHLDGLGAYIEMKYTNYADYYIGGDPANGVYFCVNGNTDTTSNMSANGHMIGTVTCTGMYPGTVCYDNLQIKGGAAGGGTYGIERVGFPNKIEVSYLIGNEGKSK